MTRKNDPKNNNVVKMVFFFLKKRGKKKLKSLKKREGKKYKLESKLSLSLSHNKDLYDDDDDDDDKVYNDDDDASYEAKGVVSRTSNRTSVMYLSANAVPVARSRTLRVLSLVNCFSQNAI